MTIVKTEMEVVCHCYFCGEKMNINVVSREGNVFDLSITSCPNCLMNRFKEGFYQGELANRRWPVKRMPFKFIKEFADKLEMDKEMTMCTAGGNITRAKRFSLSDEYGDYDVVEFDLNPGDD